MLNFPLLSIRYGLMRSLYYILILLYAVGDRLFPLIWNAVSRIENLGSIVLGIGAVTDRY